MKARIFIACENCEKCPRVVLTSKETKFRDDYRGDLKTNNKFLKAIKRI